MYRSLRLLPLAGAFALAACGGSGEGLDANGRPTSSTGPDAPLTADFQSIQDHVFTPICTQCHIGAAAPLGFRLDEGSSYAMLVSTPSVEVPSLLRVNPGNPNSSYIIQKLEGHAAVGGQMPLNQTPLPQATIDMIRQWITDGAAPAAQTALTAAAKRGTFVHVVAPLEGEAMTRSAGDPLFEADGELDAGSLNSASVVVARSGDGGAFDDGRETIIHNAQLEIRSREPTVLAVVLPASERLPGTYRVTIRATGPAPVVDRAGRPITGNTAGSASGDLVVQYSIEDLP